MCLALFTLAVAAGNQGFLAIGDWLKCYSRPLQELFGVERLPSDSTSRRTLLVVDYEEYSALTRVGVRRLIVVGGAGSLEVAPGVQLVDTPDFSARYRPASLAHRESLKIYQASDLDWTFFSPAAEFEPGERTGKFRLSKNQLLVDAEGRSRILVEDYAIALLNEVERPQFMQSQMTIAY